MKRALLIFSTSLLATLPAVSRATDLDAALACTESAHAFVTDLAQQQLIDATPMRVESNSINAFSPSRGARLSAFGFPVFAIVAYEKDDPMFRAGTGEPVANSAYGAVVFGGEEKVLAAVQSSGSTAIIHHVAPHVTAIFCKRS